SSDHPLGLRSGHWVGSPDAQLTGGNSKSRLCPSLVPTETADTGDVERLVNSNLQVWLDAVRVSSSTLTEYLRDPVGVGCAAGMFIFCGFGSATTNASNKVNMIALP